jgi:hypothetical protein
LPWGWGRLSTPRDNWGSNSGLAAGVFFSALGYTAAIGQYDMDIDQFVNLLVNSRLSSQHEAEGLVASFQIECRKENSPETVEAFCDFLIATNLFTEWQCEKLRMGKYKGFYLDNYLMLEQVGKDDKSSSYKARDTRNGKIVCLIVTPPLYAKGTGIEYRVEPMP